MSVLILVLGLCSSFFGFASDIVSRRVFIFLFWFIAASITLTQLFITRSYWLVGDLTLSLIRCVLAYLVVSQIVSIPNNKNFKFIMGIIFSFISITYIMCVYSIGVIEMPKILALILLEITTFTYTVAVFESNVLKLKIWAIISTIVWTPILAITGLYGNIVGQILALILLGWSLIEIYYARQRDVSYSKIEKANLPWRIRRLTNISEVVA